MIGGLNIGLFIIRLLDFYQILILVWCIASWLPISKDGIVADILGALDSIVRPYIGLFQRLLPPFGGLDFSPILAIAVLWGVKRLIMSILI